MLGAQTIIYLAVAEEVDGVSGKYFADCKVRQCLVMVSYVLFIELFIC